MTATKNLTDIFATRDKEVLNEHIAVPSREARAKFSKVMDFARIDNNNVVITDHGEPVAAVVPILDLRILDWLKKNNVKEFIFDAMDKGMSAEEAFYQRQISVEGSVGRKKDDSLNGLGSAGGSS